jgi:predicted small integral membrane protein
MLIVRLCKVAMTAALASFAFVVCYDNIVDYDSNYTFVRHVLSMDTTFPGNALMHRAITNEAAWKAAYALIIAAEGVTFLLLAIGAAFMAVRLRSPAAVFQRAKTWVVAGATAGFGVWFFGFMVVGGEYFAMWQSQTWNGQEAAFRFYMAVLGVMIFVNQPDPDLA